MVDVAGFCGRPWTDGFNHGFDADQTIPDSRIGWHEVAAFGSQRYQVGLVDAGGEFWCYAEPITDAPPDTVLEVLIGTDPLLEWPRHVAQVRLGCVMK